MNICRIATLLFSTALLFPAHGDTDNPAGITPKQGITDTEILIGQTAALTGVAKGLGINMRLGILAAFKEINAAGGVHGRTLRLISKDDGYEPEQTITNIHELIAKEKVFTLVGGVGTPTSKAALPIVAKTALLYIGPFTGASFLRTSHLNTVINVRASYAQETKEMVTRLRQDLNIKRIAVLYQNDSYGFDGLRGVQAAVQEVEGTKLVSSGTYRRNTRAVKTALLDIKRGKPQAVIAIGSYLPVADFIKWANKIGMRSTVFMAVSFTGVTPMAAQLKNNRGRVFVTQVVPPPDNLKSPLVINYRKALRVVDTKAQPGFISLEGYVVGRLVAAALEKAGADVDHSSFLDAFKAVTTTFAIDDLRLTYAKDDNQGSDSVFLTRIYRGKITPVRRLVARGGKQRKK